MNVGNVASPYTAANSERDGGKPLIALVDDSRLMRRLLTISLQRAGFALESYADGVELLRALREPGARIPVLVLLDIVLPKMNGYQVARALRERLRSASCAIVMVSRHNGVFNRLKARLAGANGWLDKPFTTQELLAVVRTHVQIRMEQTRGGDELQYLLLSTNPAMGVHPVQREGA